MATFFTIVTTLWILLHAYVAWRLIAPLRTRGVWRRIMYGFFVLLTPLSPSVFFADEFLSYPWLLPYQWLAWTYMGAFSTLFALLVARDLTVLLLRFVDRVMRKGDGKRGSKTVRSRATSKANSVENAPIYVQASHW